MPSPVERLVAGRSSTARRSVCHRWEERLDGGAPPLLHLFDAWYGAGLPGLLRISIITKDAAQQVALLLAVSIREQLCEIASQSVSAMREAKMSKRDRAPKAMNNAVDVFKYFVSEGSVIRKRKGWYLYASVVDVMPNEDVVAMGSALELKP